MLLYKIQKLIEQEETKNFSIETETIDIETLLNLDEIEEFKQLSKSFDQQCYWQLDKNKLKISFQKEAIESKEIFKALFADFLNLETSLEEFDAAVQMALNTNESIFNSRIKDYLNSKSGYFIYHLDEIRNAVKFNFNVLENKQDLKKTHIKIKDISMSEL